VSDIELRWRGDKGGPLVESDIVEQSKVRGLVTKARDFLKAGDQTHATRHAESASSPTQAGSSMSDLVMTRQFVAQVRPEALRAELLRHIDEGVRAIHISLTLPLREPVRCIARRDTPELGPS